MIATKVFAIAAAILAVSEVEARRKRKIKDAVTRSCASKHHATFLIDGLSSSFYKRFFHDRPNDMEVTVALGPELRIRRFNKIVKYGAKKDVSFVYRPDPAYDGSKFKKVTPKRLVKAVQRAKQQFQKLYGLKLTHVFFPYTKGYHCKKQVAAVEAAGFKVFGHNLYVDRKLGDAAKDDLKDDLRKLSKKHKGIIVYEEAHNAHLVKDLLYVEKLLKKKKYEVVGIEQCLKNGGSSEDDSEDDDGTANEANNGEMAPALQAPENPETPAESESSEKKNSASALSVSFVSIAVASVLLLAL